MNYIKSLFPFRWLAPLSMILIIECLVLALPWVLPGTLINILTWIVVDITIGLGRREERVLYNIAGLLYLFSLLGYIYYLC